MEKRFFTCILVGIFSLLSLIPSFLFSQSPPSIPYQAVVRNADGTTMSNAALTMIFKIHDVSATGTVVYQESQALTSNAQGLVSCFVGNGTAAQGIFSNINWGTGAKFLHVLMNSGNGEVDLGTQQMMSVPYALYAETVGGEISLTVSTQVADSISYRTAMMHGVVSTPANEAVLSQGFCWSTTSGPDFTDFSGVANYSIAGTFQLNAQNLTPSTLYHFKAYATSVSGTYWGEESTFTTLSLVVPTLNTIDPITVSTTSIQSGGNILEEGGTPIIEKGIVYGTSSNPTISGSHVVSTSNASPFTAILPNIQSNTIYYIRSYATNGTGVGYGNEVVFNSNTIYLPTIVTVAMSAIQYTAATSGGDIDNTAIGLSVTAKGLCWSTSPNPTVNNSQLTTGNTSAADYALTMNNLTPNTTYYVRAFYQSGVNYMYGNEISFTTLAMTLPTVTTTEPSGITTTSANIGGIVTDNGGSTIISKGVCWSTTTNPTIASSVAMGTGTGNNYFVSLTSLNPTTSYHARAFATNATGTAYGNEVVFVPNGLPLLSTVLPVVGTKPMIVEGTSYNGGGFVSEQGSSAVSTRGICWSTTNNNPTTADNIVASGTGVGGFTGSLPNVTGCGTTYYYRAYATNSYGTSYGSVLSINSGWPLVSAVTVNSLDWPNASFSASVSSDCGITQKGFVWNITGNPIINGNQPQGKFTQEGEGVGNFESLIAQFVPNKTYKIRAYAQNEVGLIYGPESTFTVNNYSQGHYIGESFAGGVIFYLDETGQHGMVRSSETIGPYLYGCGDVNSNSDISFGSGPQNTANMVGSCSGLTTGATEVLNYNMNGFSDWFLPSKEELELVFQNSILTGVSSNVDGLYLTSSQYVGDWYGFVYGAFWGMPSTGGWGWYGKGAPTYSNPSYVVPVRIF